MSNSDIKNIHLSLLEDFLPVGIAILERAKKGGPRKIFEGFTSSENPFEELRVEGTSSARIVREQLDHIKPGLGNPVIDVAISEEPEETSYSDSSDHTTLVNILNRIDDRLNAIKNHLDNPIE